MQSLIEYMGFNDEVGNERRSLKAFMVHMNE